MTWLNWFARKATTRQMPLAKGRRRARLGVESLEERATPALTTSLVSYGLPTTFGSDNSLTTASRGSSFTAPGGDVGNLFVFSSDATNLVPNDTNNATDIFLANLDNNTITRINVSQAGTQADSISLYPSISADGRYVAFLSNATNLIGGDTNGTYDVFVKDLQSGAVIPISANASGVLSDDISSEPAISSDGQFVAFKSRASNLIPIAPTAFDHIYRKKIVGGEIILVSATQGGIQGNDHSSSPALSSNGKFVVFATLATNFLGDGVDTNTAKDILLKDVDTGALSLVSANLAGTIGNSASDLPSLSGDGNLVAFQSAASNLVANDTNNVHDVFVKNVTTQTVTRVSLSSAGLEGNQDSLDPSIANDGSLVSFVSVASNLVANDSNSAADVFLRTVASSTTTRVSLTSGGLQAASDSIGGRLSPNGLRLGFASDAGNLATGDNNGLADVFVKTLSSGVVTAVSQGASIAIGGSGHSQTLNGRPAISDDGRYAAFISEAVNMVSGTDTNGTATDSFRRDLTLDLTTLVSASGASSQANNSATASSISGSGHLIAFDSSATNLVANDLNGASDVFLKNADDSTLILVSANALGQIGNSASGDPSLTRDGRFVVFTTAATNLFNDAAIGFSDIAVKDTQNQSVRLASSRVDGTQGTGDSYSASISDDGRYVAFVSDADDLVEGDNNGHADIFVKDLQNNTIKLISRNGNGTVGNGASTSPVISGDGRFVAFVSSATNLVASDTNLVADIFVSDWRASENGIIVRANVAADNNPAGASSANPSISENGRYVAFESDAINLVANDLNGVSDVFVKDLQSGAVYLVSQSTALAQGNQASFLPAISRDGRSVAFTSSASNLSSDDLNFNADVFLTNLNPAPVIATTGPYSIAEGQSLVLNASATTDPENETLTYSWDINGDGTFGDATGATPTVSWTALQLLEITDGPGSRTITLRVTDAFGSSDLQIPLTITNTPPTATITPGVIGTVEGQDANFVGSAIDPSNADQTAGFIFTWNVKRNGSDFASGTGANFVFNLADNGTYIVTLTAKDKDDAIDTKSFPSFTVTNLPPVNDLTGAPTSGVEGTPVQFTTVATDPGPADTLVGLTYTWSITKNAVAYTTGTGANIDFTPDDNSLYNVTVTATDQNGAFDTDSFSITVTDVPPVLTLGGATSVNEGSSLTLTLAASDPGTDPITQWQISWGDGSPTEPFVGTTASAQHTYADGTIVRTITVTATNDDGTFDQIKAITVNDVAPTIPLTGNATSTINTAYTLQLGTLVDPGQEIVTGYSINWGDGNIEPFSGSPSNQSHQHTYTSTANVTIRVSVTNDDGTSEAAIKPLQVTEIPPTIALNGNATTPEGSLYTLQLGPTTNNGNVSITGYVIHWGDGTTTEDSVSPPATATHTYLNGPASLAITVDLLSGVNTFTGAGSRPVSVTNVKPTIALTGAPAVNEGSLYTLNLGTITNPGSDVIASYQVNWGDGTSFTTGANSPPPTLTHTYTDGLNNRTITVTLFDNDGSHIAGTLAVVVGNVAPTVNIGTDASTFEGSLFTRAGTITDPGTNEAVTATVDYSDGLGAVPLTLTAGAFTLSHTYPNNGAFTITVVATDKDNGTTTQSFLLTVNNETPALEAGANATINEGDTFTRDLTFTDAGTDTWTVIINYGDGSADQTLTPATRTFSLNHPYTQNGSFPVTITVRDSDGAEGTDSFTVTVNNVLPVVSAGDDATINEGGTFTSSGTFTDPGTDTWSVTVNYGDGSANETFAAPGKTFNLSHVYANNTGGPFNVVVTVSDQTGTASDTRIVTVNNVKPVINAGTAATVTQNQTFTRTGTFTDPGTDTWIGTVNYGDGSGVQTLTVNNATKSFNLSHVYTTVNTFTVTVTIDDGSGPEATSFNITVEAPPPIVIVISLSGNTIRENSVNGSVVGMVTTDNTAANASGVFSLVNDAGGRFSLNGQTLVVANANLLDFETNTSHVVRVRVVNAGQTDEKDFTIQVTNLDERDEILGRDPVTGIWHVGRNTGTGFTTTSWQARFDPTHTWVDILVADFTGDGLDDVIARETLNGQWWLATSNGSSFTNSLYTTWSKAVVWTDVFAGDLNNDGKADIVGRVVGSGDWWASVTNGTAGQNVRIGNWDRTVSWVDVRLQDINGDSRPDLVGRITNTGNLYVSQNVPSNSGIGNVTLVNQISPWAKLSDGNLAARTTWVDVNLGDVNGDGKIDVVGRVLNTGIWYVCLNTGERCGPAAFWGAWAPQAQWGKVTLGDVNGDGKADLVGRANANGEWWAALSQGDKFTNQKLATTDAGVTYDQILFGNFNEDKKLDVAVRRADTGTWQVGLSSGTDLTFTLWDTWPTNPARITVRKGKFVI